MFSNEHTLHRFMMEKAEGQFHDRYEKALEQVRSEFGRTYTMVIGHMPIGGASHVRKAIAAAKEAFESWGRIDYRERVHVCRVAADIMADRKFELAAWVSYENGKNSYEAIADIDEAIDFL